GGEENDALGTDAGIGGRLLVAAGVEDLAEGGRAAQQEVEDDHEHDEDDDDERDYPDRSLSDELELGGQSEQAERAAAREEKASAARDHHEGERHDEVMEADAGDAEAHRRTDAGGSEDGERRGDPGIDPGEE